MEAAMDAQIKDLGEKSLNELKKLWNNALDIPLSPYVFEEFLILNLSSHQQAQKHGELSKSTKRQLQQYYVAFQKDPDYRPPASRPSLKPGTQLIREWQGIAHTVTVKSRGFEYQGTNFKSLSEIARLITGTRWSGPTFFGLNKKKP
jgi:hypothetical protein